MSPGRKSGRILFSCCALSLPTRSLPVSASRAEWPLLPSSHHTWGPIWSHESPVTQDREDLNAPCHTQAEGRGTYDSMEGRMRSSEFLSRGADAEGHCVPFFGVGEGRHHPSSGCPRAACTRGPHAIRGPCRKCWLHIIPTLAQNRGV